MYGYTVHVKGYWVIWRESPRSGAWRTSPLAESCRRESPSQVRNALAMLHDKRD